MQQTPNPEAQVPAAVPAFVEHSELKEFKRTAQVRFKCQSKICRGLVVTNSRNSGNEGLPNYIYTKRCLVGSYIDINKNKSSLALLME